jgi:hypothetical protein
MTETGAIICLQRALLESAELTVMPHKRFREGRSFGAPAFPGRRRETFDVHCTPFTNKTILNHRLHRPHQAQIPFNPDQMFHFFLAAYAK